MGKKVLNLRKKIFGIIEVGNDLQKASRIYDYINALLIIINVVVSILLTFENVRNEYEPILAVIETVTVAFFTVDYILRIWTARFLHPKVKEYKAIKKYMLSLNGIVDILSIFPYYTPWFFPTGTAAFRMIRLVRIFRLFRINAYYDSLSIIKEVIAGKSQQLISSMYIILILMFGSSIFMYGLENKAQPEVFTNAFSGIWWAASTLFTVGYGDIYPITFMGKLFGIIITVLGVGMVAIPTGIISAGFVDKYTSIKKRTEYGYETDMHFIKANISKDDPWKEKKISEVRLPKGIMIAAIKRREEIIIPRGDVVIEEDDTVILGAEPYDDTEKINLKEVVLRKNHKWTGQKIKDLDVSRHAIIVIVKRRNKALIPNGDMLLLEGDRVFIYTKLYLDDMSQIDI